jgi:hypothetical protein
MEVIRDRALTNCWRCAAAAALRTCHVYVDPAFADKLPALSAERTTCWTAATIASHLAPFLPVAGDRCGGRHEGDHRACRLSWPRAPAGEGGADALPSSTTPPLSPSSANALRAARPRLTTAHDRPVHTSSLDLIGNTPLVLLQGPSEAAGCEIWGKCEFANPGQSVKDARRCGSCAMRKSAAN